MIDAILGINTVDIYESYLFRFASVTGAIATYVHLTNSDKPLRALPFILTSLGMSIAGLILGRLELATYLNLATKATAAFLTIKPETIVLK